MKNVEHIVACLADYYGDDAYNAIDENHIRLALKERHFNADEMNDERIAEMIAFLIKDTTAIVNSLAHYGVSKGSMGR